MQIDKVKLEQVVRKFDPHARLLAAWGLQGGISAHMTALEVGLAQGQRRKIILRQPGDRALQHNPNAAADEYRILQFVHSAGVKCQRPYLLDLSGEILPQPYLLIEYIEGQPDYAPADGVGYAEQMATQLAKLHGGTVFDLPGHDLDFLPRQAPRLADMLKARPTTLDDSLDEGRIRSRLEAVWPLPAGNAPALLHGDFWPGNLLWREGQLVAVIDWEDAEVGNPLMDVAISRLDMLWCCGLDAMHAFTHRYQALTRFDSSQLPTWDLMAALRPASRLAEWAEGWPALGRPDMTEEFMRAGHQWFVAQAFERLG